MVSLGIHTQLRRGNDKRLGLKGRKKPTDAVHTSGVPDLEVNFRQGGVDLGLKG